LRQVLPILILSIALSGLLSNAQSSTQTPAATSTQEKPSCETLRAEKTKTYGFHPTQMTEAQIAAKSKQLDAFWKNVQEAGPKGNSCIKQMLSEEKTDHTFQFDAASMLYQADQSAEIGNLVRDSVSHADFREVDPANYLSLALELSQAGIDIRPLAARLFRYPNAVIHISEHALDLDSDTAALFLYGSMPSDVATQALIEELSAPEPFVSSAAAHLLGEQLTPEALSALSKWPGVTLIEEDYRRNDIQTALKYEKPAASILSSTPKFTREQVLKVIASLPHTRKEFDQVMATRGAEFDKQAREKKLSQQELAKAVAESEPIYGIADHTAFADSAIATLQPEDFETLRAARRKAIYNISDESLAEYLAFTQVMIGLMNRLDLYREYRAH
jgi:peptidyl-tRNA hydrolase